MADTWSNAFGDMVRQVMTFLPKVVAFLVVLALGFVAARLIAKVVGKGLGRVGFDRVVERGSMQAALARSRYGASEIVAKMVNYTIVLFSLQLAFGIWGPNSVSDVIRSVIMWLPNLFVAIVIVVVAGAIAKAVKDLIGSALSGLSYGTVIATIASVFILGLGIIAALNQIGVAAAVTTPVLIAVLATLAGVTIVGAGGGLIKPMQSRWENWLNKAENEASAMASQARAYSAGQEHVAQQLRKPATAPTVQNPTAMAAPTGTSTTPTSTTAPSTTMPRADR